MSERGVYAVARGVWDHECFADEPFTEREAWIWMIGAALWRDKRVRAGREMVDLKRGQLAFSERFMAQRWQWDRSRVHRFLLRLQHEKMVDVKSNHLVNQITICNYEKYAFSETTQRTRDEPETNQRRTKEEELKNLRTEYSEAKASAAVAAPVFEDSTHELWHEGVAILGQLGLPDKPARSNIGRWLRDAKSDAARVLGAIQRARDARTRDPVAFVTGALRTNHRPRDRGGFLDLALEIGEHEHRGYPKPRLIDSGG